MHHSDLREVISAVRSGSRCFHRFSVRKDTCSLLASEENIQIQFARGVRIALQFQICIRFCPGGRCALDYLHMILLASSSEHAATERTPMCKSCLLFHPLRSSSVVCFNLWKSEIMRASFRILQYFPYGILDFVCDVFKVLHRLFMSERKFAEVQRGTSFQDVLFYTDLFRICKNPIPEF